MVVYVVELMRSVESKEIYSTLFKDVSGCLYFYVFMVLKIKI